VSYYRFAADTDNVITRSNYDSDGDWIGDGPDPRTQMRFWRRVDKSLVIAELVVLASERTGIPVEYRPSAHTWRHLDLSGIWGELWSTLHPEYKGPFTDELNRLVRLVKTPLDEPVLVDEDVMHPGYWYIYDNSPGECGAEGLTVAECKQRFGWTEIRRCDIIGRRLRQPRNPEFGLFAKNVEISEVFSDTPTTNKPWYNTKRRRPRNSNKIKKVKL
jgi:hypothetical protein